MNLSIFRERRYSLLQVNRLAKGFASNSITTASMKMRPIIFLKKVIRPLHLDIKKATGPNGILNHG